MSFPCWKAGVKGAHFGLNGQGGVAVLPLVPLAGRSASPSPSLLLRPLTEEAWETQFPAWELREASQEAFAISTEQKALSFPPGDLNKIWPCRSRHACFSPILWLIFFM